METTYAVWYVNHGYQSDQTFSTVDAALTYAKSRGFEASVLRIEDPQDNSTADVVASWSPLNGARRYSDFADDFA